MEGFEKNFSIRKAPFLSVCYHSLRAKRKGGEAVNAHERRIEIMRILSVRRRETMGCLAVELGVTTRTIRTDITVLTADYPLETQRGNGGCVKIPDWYHPNRHILSQEHQRVLAQLAPKGDAYEQQTVLNILAEYGSPNLMNRS